MSEANTISHENNLVYQVDSAHEKLTHVLEYMNEILIGQKEVTTLTLATLMAGGHVLLTGSFGLGKTTLASSLAQSFSLQSSRIQGTPDLTPMDITGFDVLNKQTDEWEFQKGPLISELVLFDEINRAPPRTQSALLEGMAEKQVTSGNTTHKLGPPFHVIATRNPIEQMGTYPLPEAQLDRFALDIPLENPSFEDEIAITAAIRNKEKSEAIDPVMDKNGFLDLQNLVDRVSQETLSSDFHKSAVMLTRRFRPGEHDAHDDVNENIIQGPSGPRAMDTFMRVASALAIIEKTYTPDMEHLGRLARPVLGHRVALSSLARSSSGSDRRGILSNLIQKVTADTLGPK